ncbi:MAG: hypothetical protein NTZ20_05205 [Candidatus Levybacteria bacterium]|nr:hypothetical protein [Candidatus Levybacteria bacterium]
MIYANIDIVFEGGVFRRIVCEASSDDSELEELNAKAGDYLDNLLDLNIGSIYDVLNKTYVMVLFAKCLTIDVKFSLTKL